MDEKLIRSIGTKRLCREKCTPPGKKPKLNKTQQIVLEWLKKNSEWGTPTGLIYELAKRNSIAAEYIITAHDQLNDLEQFQVLAAFAEWGKEEAAK
ncbi:hypothetical protein ABE945_17045 [Enterococcus gilvus]|uniref:hypothetical protein n=1 Tax=Enterococcus gilvus TaxID=160453 RepID=UPI003D6C38B3